MSEKVWCFDTQMKQGRQGERFLLKNWTEPVRRHELLKGPDFVDAKGRVIELKCDSYDMEETPYIYAERWSDYHAKRPGGPWQALEKGATCFVYLFIKNGTWLVFEDLPLLVSRLEQLTAQKYAIKIRNKAWISTGYKVLRSDLEDLYYVQSFPPPQSGRKKKRKKKE